MSSNVEIQNDAAFTTTTTTTNPTNNDCPSKLDNQVLNQQQFKLQLLKLQRKPAQQSQASNDAFNQHSSRSASTSPK